MSSKHTVPDLPYAYDALEPAISGEIMELHHGTHHKTYVTNLNAAEEKMQAAVTASDVKKVIELQAAISFNGGGPSAADRLSRIKLADGVNLLN